jgi:lipid A ethanolaminephosphotransferase
VGLDSFLEVNTVSEPKPNQAGIAVEWLGVLCATFWALLANNHFYQKALAGSSITQAGNPLFLLGLFVLLVAINCLLVIPFLGRRWAKPLLTIMLMATALAVYFIEHYNVYLDADMLRNAIKSDPAESAEMLSTSMILPLLFYGVLPCLVVWLIPIRAVSWSSTLKRRSLILLGALVVGAVSLMTIFQPLSSFMRNQREARYLITPANYIYGLAQVAKGQTSEATKPKETIGLDAKMKTVAVSNQQNKPQVTILVVGETARAANWGLSGYARMTTPKLAQLNVVNFTDVTSCGTNTETSLPCMFAPVGRRDYNEDKIRGQQSLLHVLARAGVTVRWRDNQSGCKGVCSELPLEFVRDLLPPEQVASLCEKGGHCKDDGLLYGLDQWLQQASGNHIIVLHQLGSHGPAYFKRYPAEFDQFKPACQTENLRDCNQQQIINAYDNTLLYTDHIVSSIIGLLQKNAATVNSSLLYVADHGESLGEKNLFLHGMPYAIAPDVQKKVPMVMWFSEGLKQHIGLNESCVRDKAKNAFAHDHLFHSLLSLTQVQTQLYERNFDIFSGCL